MFKFNDIKLFVISLGSLGFVEYLNELLTYQPILAMIGQGTIGILTIIYLIIRIKSNFKSKEK